MKKIVSLLLTLALLMATIPSAFAATKYTYKNAADTYGVYLAINEKEGIVKINSYQVNAKGVYALLPAAAKVEFSAAGPIASKLILSKDKSSFEFTYDDLVTEIIKKTGKDAYEMTTLIEGEETGKTKVLRYKDVNTMVAAINKDKKLSELYKKYANAELEDKRD